MRQDEVLESQLDLHAEELQDVLLAEQQLLDIRAGKLQTIPLEEVMKQYGMDV